MVARHNTPLELILIVALMALTVAACEPACRARGRLISVGNLPGPLCSVKLHRTVDEKDVDGIPCYQVGRRNDPGASLVRLGDEFECFTIPGLKGQFLEVTASCEGYQPFRSEPFEWRVIRY